MPVGDLPRDDRYFDWQSQANNGWTPTEEVIGQNKQKNGEDYRIETEGQHPVPGLRRDTERGDQATEYARKLAA